MPPQTKFYRQLKLMEILRWEGNVNWTEFNEKFKVEGRQRFEWWLKEHIQYLSESVKRVCQDYFLGSSTDKQDSLFYRKKDQGVEALQAMYKLERSKNG